MNVKFILFCIASIGSIMMVYMWYTMHSSFKGSQLIEEQYLYRISSLKSEIDYEKRLMETLRKDTKSYGQSYQEKSIILETMKKTENKHDKARAFLEKEIEALKLDYEKVSQSHDELLAKMRTEAVSRKSADNLQIEILENDYKLLEREKDDLMAKQKKSHVIKMEQNESKSNKANENSMQGKAPNIIKNMPKIKEEKTIEKLSEENSNPILVNNQTSLNTSHILGVHKEVTKSNPVLVNPKDKEEQSLEDNKNIKELQQSKNDRISNKDKIDTMEQSIKESPGNDDKKRDSQVEPPANNLKNDNPNDALSKDDFVAKKPINPKILPKKDNLQLDSPQNSMKDKEESVHVNPAERNKPSKNEENLDSQFNHQINPPVKENKEKKKSGLRKKRIKKPIFSDIEREI